jgi:hypothetical protein
VADNAQVQVGNVVTPLTASTANTLLQDADPALYAVLAFFGSLLEIHHSARWDAEVVAAGLPDLAGHIVQTTMSMDPAYYLIQEQATPPILALYRISSEFLERTRHFSQENATWGFDWILPPLSAGQAERLLPFRNAVAKTILDRIDKGYDPAYLSGQQVFKTAGITGFKLVARQDVRLSPPALQQTMATFEELHLRFEVREQVRPMPDTYSAMQGVSTSVSGQNADGIFPDVSNFQANNP